MSYLNFNGKLLADDKPILLVSNRGYRYGDGLFETMKIKDGKILLSEFHFDRLFSSLAMLMYEVSSLFNAAKLEKEIINLCQKNGCEQSGRVRLSIFRGNGGINDPDKTLQYLIECWQLNDSVDQLNENGLIIDVYPDARKSVDKFSNIKSANFLHYSLAAIYAKDNKLNDCLVLNANGNIADATIANLFIIKDGIIKTPGLTEGCVNGVMRKYLIEKFSGSGFTFEETVVSIDDVGNADEVFLTNAINGIRWVKQFRKSTYTNVRTIEIFNQFIKTIHA